MRWFIMDPSWLTRRLRQTGLRHSARRLALTRELAEPITVEPVGSSPARRERQEHRPRLRIAQVAGAFEPVPPRGYGGNERVIEAIVRELINRGHDVTTYASGDSKVPGRLVATVPEALRAAGFDEDGSGFLLET